MKAYISDGAWMDAGGQRLSDMAVAEARAILAETEPVHVVQTIAGRMLDDVFMRVPLSCKTVAGAALADALRAFVSDEWLCTGACGTIRYASLMSGRGGLRACPACGSLAEKG